MSAPTTRRCPHCGYDLRAQVAGRAAATVTCPECGETVPPPTRVCREPTLLWHAIMAISFGVPLVVMALEAARQMIKHATWLGRAWVDDWFTWLMWSGAIGVVVGTGFAMWRSRRPVRYCSVGVVYTLIYIMAVSYMSQWIIIGAYR